MLVLKRKVGETLMIGDHIRIQILGIEGDQIKIGFEAPKHVQILRGELYEGIREENVQAGTQPVSQEQLKQMLQNKFKGSS